MPRTKNNYTSAMLQRRVPEELKPELDEIITNRVASFKREQAAKERMQPRKSFAERLAEVKAEKEAKS